MSSHVNDAIIITTIIAIFLITATTTITTTSYEHVVFRHDVHVETNRVETNRVYFLFTRKASLAPSPLSALINTPSSLIQLARAVESAATAAAAAKARETELSKRLEENAQSTVQAAQAARLREGTLTGELSDAQHKIVELGGRADRAEVNLLLSLSVVVASLILGCRRFGRITVVNESLQHPNFVHDSFAPLRAHHIPSPTFVLLTHRSEWRHSPTSKRNSRLQLLLSPANVLVLRPSSRLWHLPLTQGMSPKCIRFLRVHLVIQRILPVSTACSHLRVITPHHGTT